MKRWIIRITLGLLAALALCIAVPIAANWRDDPLTPRAARLLAPPAPLVPDAANAYYVFQGLDAPDDEDAWAVGRRIREAIDRLPGGLETPKVDIAHSATICMGTQCGWEKIHCSEQSADCVNFYLGQRARARQVMAQQSVLRQRYQQFSQLPLYAEPPMRFMAEPLPMYRLLAEAAELRLMDAVFALDNGDTQTGAQVLMEQIHAHRVMLAGSSLLISKMVATGMLHRDYEVLSEAIERWPALAQQAELAEAWRPLSEPECSLRTAVESEAGSNARMFHRMLQEQRRLRTLNAMKDDSEGLLTPFVLPNATLNIYARWAAEDAEAIVGDARTVQARRLAHAARREQEWKQIAPYASWRFIRNPVGKVLLTMPTLDFFDWAERLHDLDGHIRLVALQATLRRDGAPRNQIADYVQQTGPDLRSPYDGEPMRWDEEHATLSFTGRQKKPDSVDTTPRVFSVHMLFGEAAR